MCERLVEEETEIDCETSAITCSPLLWNCKGREYDRRKVSGFALIVRHPGAVSTFHDAKLSREKRVYELSLLVSRKRNGSPFFV